MLKDLINAIVNYDPEASGSSKLEVLNGLLAKLIEIVEKYLKLAD